MISLKPKLAVPSYFYPGPEWPRMLKKKPAFVIINPNSGPGALVDKNYVRVVGEASRAGVKILGYVSTIWSARPRGAVLSDIDAYRKWYPGLSGFFFDEASTRKVDVGFYKSIMPAIGQHVLNPGTWPDEEYARLGAVLMVYETTLDKYVAKEPPAWASKYHASTYWHCVFAVKTLIEMERVRRLALKRGAGYLYVTDDSEEGDVNPYDRLPSYWEKL